MLRQLSSSKEVSAKKQFSNQTESFLFSLNERYERNRVLLEGIDGFFASSDFVSFKEWNRYISSLKLSEKFPEISWVAFIKNLAVDEKLNFIKSTKEEIPNFNIWPENSSSFCYPIVYISPNPFDNLIGFDFYTNEKQRQSLEKSVLSKSLTTSSFIELNPTKIRKSERILFIPIIKNEKNEIFGWIGASIDFSTIMEQTGKGVLPSNVDLDVYAGDKPALQNLIFQKSTISLDGPFLSTTKVLDFAGTTWTFVFKSAIASNKISAYGVFLFLFLLLISILLGLFLYFRYLKASGIVDYDSQIEKWILYSTQYAVVAADLKGIITYFNPAAEKLLGYSSNEVIGKKTPEIFHDPEEMALRAEELSSILNKEVKSGFEVFVSLAEKDIPECRRWTYIKKDKSKTSVQLSVTTLKNYNKEIVGYIGFSIEASQLKF